MDRFWTHNHKHQLLVRACGSRFPLVRQMMEKRVFFCCTSVPNPLSLERSFS